MINLFCIFMSALLLSKLFREGPWKRIDTIILIFGIALLLVGAFMRINIDINTYQGRL